MFEKKDEKKDSEGATPEWQNSLNLEQSDSNIAEANKEDGKKNGDESWLPPKTSIAEEIDAINRQDGAKGLVDGDIMPPPLENRNDEHENENEKRNAIRDRRGLWRTRVLPYVFDGLSAKAQQVIADTIREYEQKTCIRFKRVSAGSSEHYIRFFPGPGTKFCAVFVDFADAFGPVGPKPPAPVTSRPPAPPQPPTGGSGGINEAICGTRAHGLAHPALNPQQIVGGSNARPGDWPWQVGFASAGSTFVYCGGTLVSDEWIISAAHCFQRGNSPSSITARLGDHNRLSNEGTEQVIRLSRVINHPRYNSRTQDNDIALLRLSRKVKFTKYIRPACLPSAAAVIRDGADAFVSGWGTTREGGSTSPILQVARVKEKQKVPIVSEATCKRTVGGITDAMICAGFAQGGIDSCQGDSGGPLVLKSTNGKYYLGGVVSWGIGCARRGKYGVYARVTALRSWLDTILPKVAKPATKPPNPATRPPNPATRPPKPPPVVTQGPGVGSSASLATKAQPNTCPTKCHLTRLQGHQTTTSCYRTIGVGSSDDVSCSFDKDACGWFDDDIFAADWVRVKTKLGVRDHGTEKGSFMALTPTAGSAKTEAGLSSSLMNGHAKPKCLEIFYRTTGFSGKSLAVSISTDLEDKTILSLTKSTGRQWNIASATIAAGNLAYTVGIVGSISGSRARDMIAFDDLALMDGACPSTAPAPSPSLLTCAFEIGSCHWQQAKDDNFDWTRRKGRTPSGGTGPTTGATGANDFYLYIETSYPRSNGQVATLRSPTVNSNVPMCLTMKAHMFGRNVNALKVFKVDEGSGAETELWKKTGNQGNKWIDVSIDLPPGAPFQVAISGVRGNGYRGDIAIDEIRVRPNKCGSGGTGPAPTKPPVKPPAGGCGVPDVPLQRVISGKNAARGSWPWQILMLYGGRPICGGTLINPTTVVTAAHCVSGREAQAASFRVRVGEHDTRATEGSEVDIPVSRIISHPSYSRRTIDFDVAVMKLARPATLGKFVKTACLPAVGQAPAAGSTCYITGFGKVRHPGNMHHTLQQAPLKVVSQQECTRLNTGSTGLAISSRMICAGNGAGTTQSGCHGDSGGPFVCNSGGKWYLQGAVSWGSGTCSAASTYTVFAKTSEVNINAWIRRNAA
eukprot:Seg1871.3 transcript_id=Seg1871.3/GoldUCD/mRNA.D3Y31 product="Transmembrane protease serine 9" protein_id=Seg1871.3/GoldUCD/D3Y31